MVFNMFQHEFQSCSIFGDLSGMIIPTIGVEATEHGEFSVRRAGKPTAYNCMGS